MQIVSEAPLLSEPAGELPDEGEADKRAQELEFMEVSDMEALMQLIATKNASEPFKSEAGRSPKSRDAGNHLPTTLREALKLKGCLFTNLVRLAIKLRNAHGGMDVGFLPNAMNCRKASKGLNWYQQLVCKGLNLYTILLYFDPFWSIL